MKKLFKDKLSYFLLGAVIFSGITAGATSLIYSKDVSYDNSSSGLSSTTVQGALDELYEQAKNSPQCDSNGVCTIKCPTNTSFFGTSSGYKCNNLSTALNLGDYISFTPSLTTYSTIADYVGGSSYIKTINPRELNLWRVLHKNEDGTIDIVSEYTSSNTVTFKGRSSYTYYIKQLNLIAKAYENNKYTISSRYLGFFNQEEISDNPDTGYTNDLSYLKEAGINTIAYEVGTAYTRPYYLASKYDDIDSGGDSYYIRIINTNGNLSAGRPYWTCCNSNYGTSYYLRPVVTLKSVQQLYGSGTSDNPYVLQSN